MTLITKIVCTAISHFNAIYYLVRVSGIIYKLRNLSQFFSTSITFVNFHGSSFLCFAVAVMGNVVHLLPTRKGGFPGGGSGSRVMSCSH